MNNIKKNLIKKLVENQITSEEDSYGFFHKAMEDCGFTRELSSRGAAEYYKATNKKYRESASNIVHSELFWILRTDDNSEYFEGEVATHEDGNITARVQEWDGDFDSGRVYVHKAGFYLVKTVIGTIKSVNSNYRISKVQVLNRAKKYGIHFDKTYDSYEEANKYFEKIVNFLNEIIDEANEDAYNEDELVSNLEYEWVEYDEELDT